LAPYLLPQALIGEPSLIALNEGQLVNQVELAVSQV
jgi:hypothetical protein